MCVEPGGTGKLGRQTSLDEHARHGEIAWLGVRLMQVHVALADPYGDLPAGSCSLETGPCLLWF